MDKHAADEYRSARTWAQPGLRSRVPMRSRPSCFFWFAFCALTECDVCVAMVLTMFVPPVSWLRLMLNPKLKAKDRTRATWVTSRRTGTRQTGLNPSLTLLYAGTVTFLEYLFGVPCCNVR